MALPFQDSFTGGAGVLGNPPYTQANIGSSGKTVNLDGAGSAKASAVDASLDIAAYDNSNTYNNDQYAFATISGGLASGTNYAEIFVRCTGTGATFKGYQFLTDGASGAGHTELWLYSGGTGTLLRNFATTFTTGDVMKIDVVGTTITCYKNGASLGTQSNAVATTGAPGIGMFNGSANNLLLDTFEAGSVGVTILPALGVLAVAGLAATVALTFNKIVAVGAAVLSLTAFAPTVNSGIHVNDVLLGRGYSTPNDVILNGYLSPVGSSGNVTVAVGFGQLAVAGPAPSAVVNTFALPSLGVLTATGLSPTVLLPQIVTPNLGSLTIVGLAPTPVLTANQIVLPGLGALAATGLTPTIKLGINVLPGLGSLVLTGLAPTAIATNNQVVLPGLGQLTLTGLAPSALFPNNQTVLPGLGQATLTGLAPSTVIGIHILPGLGVPILAGLAPTLVLPQKALPGLGALTITGLAPGVGGSQTAFPGLGQSALTGLAPTVNIASGALALAMAQRAAIDALLASLPSNAGITQNAGTAGIASADSHSISISSQNNATISINTAE